MSSYPHVFLDASALYKLAYSLAYHRIREADKKSRIRIAMEYGILRVATTYDLIEKAEAAIERHELGTNERAALIDELEEAVRRGWIELKSGLDLLQLDEVRYYIARELGNEWYEILAERDREDAEMLKSAATIYACNCIIRTRRGYYVPSYFLIVSEDNDVYDSRSLLNLAAITVLRRCARRFESVKLYGLRKLISVAKWNGFKAYVKKSLAKIAFIR